jgi:outer membrane protein OmpA-like peptidoglycan-associated protein
MKANVYLVLCLLLSKFIGAQTPNRLNKTPQSDCVNAIKLPIYKSFKYANVAAPQGIGESQEIDAKGNNLVFAQEHHSAWYVLNFNKGGDFTFKINPIDSTNDYDFLVYKITDSLYCSQIKSNKIKPVRNNISRNNTKNKGITGLSIDAQSAFSKPGPGKQFSQFLTVAKGDKYVLVIDNVYKNGNGFSIDFELSSSINIKGVVIDDDGKPLVAKVILTDSLGNVVTETQSATNGVYEMKAMVLENKNYQLFISGKNTFFETIPIKGNQPNRELKTTLPVLKKDKTYKLDQINFEANSAEPLREAYPSIQNLVRLMTLNPELEIVIEGHVNGTTSTGVLLTSEYDVKRHEEIAMARANKVASFLKAAKVDDSRYEVKGFGSRKMLFPNAKTLEEQKANRRVEIRIK